MPPDLAPDAAEAATEVTPDDAGDVESPEAAAPAYDGPWRKSLASCWLDATCNRALLVSHGGDWGPDLPYDSAGAFHRAYDNGADGIKTDVLVTADNVAVVAHSSPILFYESVECVDDVIENMTAAQVTACHLATSTTETYQRLDDVLEWARDKVVIMLTVKSDAAWARAMSTAIEHDATGYVFLEAYTGAFMNTVPTAPDYDQFHYNVQIGGLSDLDELLPKAPLFFSSEMTTTYPDATAAQMTTLIATRLHPAGVKAFIDANGYVTVADQLGLFQEGFDIVMTYDLTNGVQARIQTNQARGLTSP